MKFIFRKMSVSRIQTLSLMVLFICSVFGPRDLFSYCFGFFAGISFFSMEYAKEILGRYNRKNN